MQAKKSVAISKRENARYDRDSYSSFRLTVKEPGGRPKSLICDGVSEVAVVRKVIAHGFQVLSIEPNSTPKELRKNGSTKSFPLLLFSQELLALLDAGLNLNEALATLHAKETQIVVMDVMQQIIRSLHEGRSFSDALTIYPNHFNEVFIATIRAAERTGDLPQALSRYITYQIQFDDLRKKLVSAAIYPVTLLVIGGFVTLFLLGYVVPRFSAVYESSGRDMPGLSALLLSFGKIIYNNWQAALSFFVIGFICLMLLVTRRESRTWLLAKFLQFPWLVTRVEQLRLARFYRALSLLLSAGVALPQAIEMVSGLLTPRQQISIERCRLSIQQGQSLSSSLMNFGLSSPVAESLIKVGERSGQMAEMLERTAKFSDEEFSRWMDWASRLLEPVLMTVIGLIIGTIVVLMYLPIFELAGSL